MKLLGQVLTINSALIGLLLLFKNSINHIKTGISAIIIAAPKPVFIIAPHIGSKRNASKLTKEQRAEVSISVKEVPQ